MIFLLFVSFKTELQIYMLLYGSTDDEDVKCYLENFSVNKKRINDMR
jgi:hypothetical protein